MDNPAIKDLSNFLGPDAASQFPQHGAVKSRYVGYLTFALNYRSHGLDVWGYHLVNLSIHVLNAALLYGLVLLTMRTPALSRSALAGRSRGVALLAASLFVAHPVQTEAVTYVFQRHASLAALFCLLAITSYAGSRLSRGRASGLALYVLSLVSMALAMKSKENAFTFPLVIALYEAVFFRRAGQEAQNFKFQISNLRSPFVRLLPLLLTMLIVPLSLLSSGEPAGEAPPEGYATSGRWQYLITQPRVAATYLRLLLLPVNQNIDYDYPAFGSLLAPGVLLPLALIAGLVVLSAWLVARSRRGGPELALVGFGLLWFFIALSVESSAIPIPMLINEYRLYLPSAGFFVAIAAGGALMYGRSGGRGAKALRASAIAAVLLMALATFARNALWASEALLWEDTVNKSPGKARGYYNLALFYHKNYVFDRAIRNYQSALRLRPGHQKAHMNLGNAFIHNGPLYKAVEHMAACLALHPDSPGAHNNLAIAYMEMDAYGPAISHLEAALALKPDYVDARYNLGRIYIKMGDLARACRELEAALGLDPKDVECRELLAYARELMRRKQ